MTRPNCEYFRPLTSLTSSTSSISSHFRINLNIFKKSTIPQPQVCFLLYSISSTFLWFADNFSLFVPFKQDGGLPNNVGSSGVFSHFDCPPFTSLQIGKYINERKRFQIFCSLFFFSSVLRKSLKEFFFTFLVAGIACFPENRS